jgi:predicted permease
MSWLRRFANLLRPNRLGRDIDREMHFHVRELVDELVSGGMTDEDARREAQRRFGHHQVLKERVRDVDLPAWLDAFQSDVRYAIRGLVARPGFTLVVVLSLALGIGANTAIYSLINAVMLRSLPVRDPESLVMVTMDDVAELTNPIWESVRDRQDVLAETLAFSEATFDLANGGVVRLTPATFVSGSYFRALGVQSAEGRVLSPADDVRGCQGAAVLSHGFWQREYGGAPDAVGRTISLDGRAFEIVGVAATGFTGVRVGSATSVFIPLCAMDVFRPGRLDNRSFWAFRIFGRLRPGTSMEAALAGLGAISRPVFEAAVPTNWTAVDQKEFMESALRAEPAPNGVSSVRRQYQDALLVLLGVVGVVLLIACANVAQLLLARAAAREREIALRLAIGSSRSRLVRQLLTESVLLSFAGAAVGLLFARWSSALLVSYINGGDGAVVLDLSLDGRVLAFAIAIATVTGVLFGLVPAWRSAQVDPQAAMRSAGRGLAGSSRQPMLKVMVVGQMALSLVLVVAAALLGGSFQRLTAVDPGFERSGVLLVDLSWSRLGYPDARQAALRDALLERLRGVPGVRDAGASLLTPISGSFWNDFVAIDGYTPSNRQDALIWFNAITPGYLATLGIDLLDGRDLSEQDRQGSQRVALVTRTTAHKFFGDASPLGRQIRTDANGTLSDPMTIVGVIEDLKYGALTEGARPQALVPLAQAESWGPAVAVALRSNGDPAGLIPDVTRAMRGVNEQVGLRFTTLEDQVSQSLMRPRLLATVSGFFGALALILAVIGLYGVISYGVARRRGEIGVRLALGASRQGVLRMVATEVGVLVMLGVLLGVPLTIAAARLVAAFLYGVTPTDAGTMTASALILAGVAMLAAAVPAWRAASVDPMVALRKE